jgi:hypothetical protein
MLIAALAIIGLSSKPTAERQKGKNSFTHARVSICGE